MVGAAADGLIAVLDVWLVYLIARDGCSAIGVMRSWPRR